MKKAFHKNYKIKKINLKSQKENKFFINLNMRKRKLYLCKKLHSLRVKSKNNL